MIECPGCGADLRFSIEEQRMVCGHCGNKYDPKAVPWGKEAALEENGEYETTVFSCPQCGGEILSTGNEAAQFCSYCGASVVLSGRVSRGKAPQFIIPFKIPKSASKELLIERAKKVHFVPRIYKDRNYLDRVIPYYIPYWSYDVEQKGEAALTGTRVDNKNLETCSLS